MGFRSKVISEDENINDMISEILDEIETVSKLAQNNS